MYRQEKPMSLKSSASAVANNLSIAISMEAKVIHYAVVHKSIVNAVSASMDGSTVNHRQIICKEPSSANSSTMVFQARLLTIHNKTLLVIAGQKTIQIYDVDGSIMVFFHTLDDADETEGFHSFARGICSFEDITYVGTNKGQILGFQIPAKNYNIKVVNTIRAHSSAITSIETVTDRLVSTDDNGEINLWNITPTANLTQKLSIKGQGWPCTAVGLWHNLIVAAYATGHLKIYKDDSGQVYLEAAGHGKWITALDIAQGSGLVITASEDSFFRIWKLKCEPYPEIDMLWSDCVANVQLQGAKFLTPDGRAFGLTGYDSNEVYFYKQ